jgi:hypothetical protein
MSTLLSGLLVGGLRRGASRTVAGAAGRALGGAVGGVVNGGFGGGSSAPTATRRSETGDPDAPTTVETVDVTGTPIPSLDPTSVAGQVIGGGAGINALNGGTVSTVDVNGQPTATDDTVQAPVDVSGIDIVGTPLPKPAVVSPVAPFSTGGEALTTLPDRLDLTQPEEVTPAGDPISVENVAMLAPLAALGLIPTGSTLPAAGAITPPGEGGLPFGVKPTDLVAGGLLAAGLAGGAGGGGANTDAIKELAAGQKELAGRLGGIADAGFQGNIGSKGLNSIARMVRKAQAAIRQRYAAMNMSGSTAEQDDLNSAVESGVDLQFKIGQQMAQTGLSAVSALTGQSAQAYLQLLNAQTQKDTALGNALANFAAAVAK